MNCLDVNLKFFGKRNSIQGEDFGFNRVFEMKPAFTLAEVLVTLGIIGVVSAMTVPTLMQNYQRQSYVTQLHKVYNEVGQQQRDIKRITILSRLMKGVSEVMLISFTILYGLILKL